MNKITIIGTGYVGLVQGVVLSEFGMDVTCVDVDEQKIQKLAKGISLVYEPGLQSLLEKNLQERRIHFTTNINEAVRTGRIIFIAVGTPPKEDGTADLQYVLQVADSIAKYIDSYKVIVNKSTVPVGTGQLVRDTIAEKIQERSASVEFDVVSNPEFLREGNAVKDCLQPDRVVIGADSQRAIDLMKQVYDVLYINQTPFVITNIKTAELIKYAANAYLAVKISYINEMALLAEKVGADINIVAKAMGMDGRISPKFLHAGPGYGGSCFPKDTNAIVRIAREHGEELMVVEAAIAANQKQKQKSAQKIITTISETVDLSEAVVAVWGLSFKPETDDMRDAPSIEIIRALVLKGIRIRAYCPQGMAEAQWRLLEQAEAITYCTDEYDAVDDADALVVVTEWNQFRGADLEKVKRLMRNSYLFDLRNVYKRHIAKNIGFYYYGTGR